MQRFGRSVVTAGCRLVGRGIGSGMVYLPAVVMVGQYFQKRRALAQGLSTTGTGFGTFLITVLLKYLCVEFGWAEKCHDHSGSSHPQSVCMWSAHEAIRFKRAMHCGKSR
ncbi:unnamed protein product [Ranitomeya imitator]|uniref:Uncharacterized protein n=1 Tax=Ranitomeya imitator TaxID=111125 RepID=A0ABN9KYU5_9NEOB|nr:unnamed protein product [Ranitomeya imitator]